MVMLYNIDSQYFRGTQEAHKNVVIIKKVLMFMACTFFSHIYFQKTRKFSSKPTWSLPPQQLLATNSSDSENFNTTKATVTTRKLESSPPLYRACTSSLSTYVPTLTMMQCMDFCIMALSWLKENFSTLMNRSVFHTPRSFRFRWGILCGWRTYMVIVHSPFVKMIITLIHSLDFYCRNYKP